MNFAQRVRQVKPSPTLALNTRAKKMQAEGLNVINFTCGEPDFDTPLHIKNAAIEAINGGFTKYTPDTGIVELKDAVIRALKREQGLEYRREEIIITPGAKYAIFAALQALISSGDEVIIPAPYWVSYPDQTLLCEGRPVIIQAGEGNDFKITAEQLEEAITEKTRILILNTPSNPTGSAYTKEELGEIAKVCVRRDILVISDEIYDHVVFNNFKCTSIAKFEGMRERTIIINGVSKRFAMTGWRVGFAAAPAELIAKMAIIQGQAVTNVTSISQKAAVAAYDGGTADVEKMVAAFCERRNFIVSRLNELGLKCRKPEGAFYAFPNVESLFGRTLIGRGDPQWSPTTRAGTAPPFGGIQPRPYEVKITSSADVSECLLESAHVATVPGSAFGLEGFIRLSFATSMENIKEGLNRIEKAIINDN